MNKKEYWVFIDDSGNIELSSPDNFFIYAALVFDDYENVEKFREEYKNLINEKFKYELKRYKNEVKGNQRISFNKRKLIYDLITNTSCKLVAIIEEKKKSKKLHEIESDFNDELKLMKKMSAMTKKEIKQIRKDGYGRHKSYLIGQLICLIVEEISSYNSESRINIIIDNENLLTPGNFIKFEDYLTHEQKYLKKFSHKYESKMEDSKKEYCLQGADFLAHSVYKKYNERENNFFEYINERTKVVIKTFPHIKKLKKEKEISMVVDKELENDNI